MSSRRRSRSPSAGSYQRSCSSNDPRDLERRIFVGNLPTSDMEKKDLEELFSTYGKVVGVSMFRGFGFVQFEHVEEAEAAKLHQKGRIYKGYKIDVNMAVERRSSKPQSRQSPPRRAAAYSDSRPERPRSRSPAYAPRESRDSRDGREPGRESSREPSREPRSRGEQHRDHDERYRGSASRDKEVRGDPRGDSRSDPRADPRADPRDPAYREPYDRYYRGGATGTAAADDYYRKKDDPYREPYRDPWNGRREAEPPVEDRVQPGERRRNELYRQYYEELQRRYDTARPVDCSVIVVNKAQNREYAETVGRKVRDLGMVVDLIFLNTEVSLTQALEDVGRARTPFAIIITQQHQVHRSCTVNILFGTPQEHRNMPMQDAMVLVAHNYDAYKVEHRDKERDEIARKAAKMADDVLLREPDRESHPISQLTTITLLTENRFVTPEELDSMILYLKDKRERLVRGSDAHPAAHREAQPPVQAVAPTANNAALATQPSHLAAASSAPPNPSHQAELQAKILSLFNSGAGASVASSVAATSTASQAYSSMAQQPPAAMSHMPPSQSPQQQQQQAQQMMGVRPSGMPPSGPPPNTLPPGYGMPPGRMQPPAPALGGSPAGARPQSGPSGINFDNPSVQKALDTLIQSGPSLNHLVNSGSSQQQQQPPPARPGPGMPPSMGQAPPMSMYSRHY